MPAGRPTAGLHHIDQLEGSTDSKLRLKAILTTLTGEQTIVDACETLGIRCSRFHVMRHEALQAAISRLERHAPGRKPKAKAVDSALADLRRRTSMLEQDLVLARTQAEVSEILPGRGRRKRG